MCSSDLIIMASVANPRYWKPGLYHFSNEGVVNRLHNWAQLCVANRVAEHNGPLWHLVRIQGTATHHQPSGVVQVMGLRVDRVHCTSTLTAAVVTAEPANAQRAARLPAVEQHQ